MAKEQSKEMTDYLAALKLVNEREKKINPDELKALRRQAIADRIPHWKLLVVKKTALAAKLHERAVALEERSVKAMARVAAYQKKLDKWL